MTSPDDEVVAEPAQERALVDLEPDAVAEPVEVAVLERLPRLLGQLGRLAGLDVGLAGALEQRAAVGARAQVRVHALERVLREPPVLRELLRRLAAARHERARHVGVAARRRRRAARCRPPPARRRRSRRSPTRGRSRPARRGRRSRRRTARSRTPRGHGLHRGAHVLGGQPGRSSWIRSRAVPIAASAAVWARRMPSSWTADFTRRRRTNSPSSTVSSTPLARR